MSDKELISVIIPSFNRRDKILQSVESVLNQSYENIELIVVDDASTDGTWELFESYPDKRLRFLRYEDNRGACYARNYGAASSKGSYIAFQDSDDIWHTDKLEKQLEHIMSTDADLSFCGMNRISVDGSQYCYPVHPFHGDKALEEMLAENRAGTQTMLMKRQVWEQLRFDESFRRYQDWDFSIRAAEAFKLSYMPETLVDSPVGEDSISAAVNSYPALVKLYEKHSRLYSRYPQSNAVMNRRMGKRLEATQPEQAAEHFLKSLKLSHNPYDFNHYISSKIHSMKGGMKK
jgi:glycosyltransferase involved in cell wall biosynthesis